MPIKRVEGGGRVRARRPGAGAQIRVIRCAVDSAIAHDRIARRAEDSAHRAAHADHDLLDAIAAGRHSLDSFVPISLEVPALTVDTTHGYEPGIHDIVAFAGGSRTGTTA